MAKPPACEECGCAAEVELQGPIALCRHCAGLSRPGFLNWYEPHKMWPCVVCGRKSIASRLSGVNLEWPLCEEHVMSPVWQIQLELAWQAFEAALLSSPPVPQFRGALLRLATWLNERFGDE